MDLEEFILLCKSTQKAADIVSQFQNVQSPGLILINTQKGIKKKKRKENYRHLKNFKNCVDKNKTTSFQQPPQSDLTRIKIKKTAYL